MGRRKCKGWRLLNAWIRQGAFSPTGVNTKISLRPGAAWHPVCVNHRVVFSPGCESGPAPPPLPGKLGVPCSSGPPPYPPPIPYPLLRQPPLGSFGEQGS